MATKDNPEKLIEAATAYMRVVALFKDTDNKPHVADSLFKAGAIEEQLHKPAEAILAYQQVAAIFKDTQPQFIQQADEDIKRLQAPKTNQ